MGRAVGTGFAPDYGCQHLTLAPVWGLLMSSLQEEARTRSGLFSSNRWPHFVDWQTLGQSILDLIFPPTCVNCGRVDTTWCYACLAELEQVPISIIQGELDLIEAIIGTGWHTGILQHAVQALKYQNARSLAQPLAQRLSIGMTQQEWPIDILIPVPLHSLRLQNRGYNQAKLIAEALSAQADIPVVDALQRERNTPSQVGLNRTERLANVEGAFVATVPSNTKSALIIDDVRTTGATLTACAKALKHAGVPIVYAATITVAEF